MESSAEKYFCGSGNDTRERLNRYFSNEVAEFARLIDKMNSTLMNFHHQNLVYDKEKPYHPAFGLMKKGTNTLAAAFELTLNGYLWEPPGLLRIALETFSVAWDIVHNPDRFDQWRNQKKFESTLSISRAKEVSPSIGQLNGMLSKMNIHISPINSSPAMIQAEEPQFQFLGYIEPGRESIREPETYMALLLTYICLQLTELCFYRYSDDLETIEIMEEKGTAKLKLSREHQPFKHKMEMVFRKLANGEVA